MNNFESNLEYLVHEEEGIVICKIWDCRDLAVKRIRKYTSLGSAEAYKYAINNIFVGVSKCSSDDDFNLEYGKRLALDRAKAKRGKAVNSAIKRYITDMRKRINKLELEGIRKIPDIERLLLVYEEYD